MFVRTSLLFLTLLTSGSHLVADEAAEIAELTKVISIQQEEIDRLSAKLESVIQRDGRLQVNGRTVVTANSQWVGSNEGLIGNKGPRGPKGPTGETGAPGKAGKNGTNGGKGDDGPRGRAGTQTGPQGPKGPVGDQGPMDCRYSS